MKLYRTGNGPYVEHDGSYYRVPLPFWDAIVTQDDLHGYLLSIINKSEAAAGFTPARIEAPIGNQAVWAAGVTYYRSRSAKMAESKDAGGSNFYDRVYSAECPEVFFKATVRRVYGGKELGRGVGPSAFPPAGRATRLGKLAHGWQCKPCSRPDR